MGICSIEAEGAPAGGGGGEAAPAAFYEAFKNEAVKTHPSVQRYKDTESLAEAYINAEKRLGVPMERHMVLPEDPKDTAGMRAIFAKLGLPEKADGYGMTLDDKASDADRAMLTDFTAKAHELGLPADMAKGVMAFWMEKTTAAAEAAQNEWKASADAGTAALKAEWGAAYDQRTREIGNLLAKYGDQALQTELDGAKLANYPNLAKFLGKMIERMAEPGALPGAGSDLDNGQRSMTPAQAKAAARVAEAHPAMRDRSHPQHKAQVEERNRLLAMAEAKAA